MKMFTYQQLSIKKNSTKKIVYFLSSSFELAIQWRRKRKQSRQRRRKCWTTTTSIMWLSYVKKIASTMRTTISKAFWKIFTWIEHCDDDSQTQWIHKNQKIEHRDDVDHASWIRKRKKKRCECDWAITFRIMQRAFIIFIL